MKMLLWTLLGGSIVSITACGDKEAEVCNDSVDNDGNGLTDCYDDACATDATCVDADGDGFALADDCNDENALTYPGADEICDDLQKMHKKAKCCTTVIFFIKIE